MGCRRPGVAYGHGRRSGSALRRVRRSSRRPVISITDRPKDRIELSGIRVLGTIGVLPEEQQRAQPFEIDLVMEVDVRAAGEKDDLDASVNYAIPIELVEQVVSQERHLLLERSRPASATSSWNCHESKRSRWWCASSARPCPRTCPRPPSASIALAPDRLGRCARRPRRTSPSGPIWGIARNAASAVRELPDVGAMSGIYETDPIGGPDDQGAYLNMVVEVQTRLDPYALLDACRHAEQTAGRERKVRWGPRTLDVDVLLYGDTSIHSEELTVPHPRMFERRFVLAPLAEIAPNTVPVDWDQRLPAGGVTRIGELRL
ncbi:MAG: 2-amino-4-hydroxy-6-hydroxymethyldihydropteridine diphosphokinase [Ilumatobacteraceae bacterium]